MAGYNHYFWRMVWLLPLALVCDLISMSQTLLYFFGVGVALDFLDIIWAPLAYGFPMIPFLKNGGIQGSMFPIVPAWLMIGGIASELIPFGDLIPIFTILWFFYAFSKVGPVAYYFKFKIKKKKKLPVFNAISLASHKKIRKILLGEQANPTLQAQPQNPEMQNPTAAVPL